jgi:hypothetical protein
LQVNVPSLEDILGDKFTAFAPNTTGIPYFKKEDSMSMEIIKQLYDIGNLFDVAQEFTLLKLRFISLQKLKLLIEIQKKLQKVMCWKIYTKPHFLL